MNLSKFSVITSNVLRYHKHNTYILLESIRHASHCGQNDIIVTILNAAHKIGRNAALLLKQNPKITEMRLYDKDPIISNIAEDLSHIDTKTRIRSYSGISVMKHAISGANVVVTVGGCKKSPWEKADALFEKNVDDIRLAALHMIEFNPTAIFCIARPPIEALVPVVYEEYKKAGIYNSKKIIGITSIGTMRANYFISLISGGNATEVVCPIVGGLSTNCMVAVISQCANCSVSPNHHALIQANISGAEDDVLKLYGDGQTVCLAPAVAVARFINNIVKSLAGESNCVECAFVRQTRHIATFLPYMTSIVRLGKEGVISAHMPKISGEEAELLRKASVVIKENIRMGESFITGEVADSARLQENVETANPSEKDKRAKKKEAST